MEEVDPELQEILLPFRAQERLAPVPMAVQGIRANRFVSLLVEGTVNDKPQSNSRQLHLWPQGDKQLHLEV